MLEQILGDVIGALRSTSATSMGIRRAQCKCHSIFEAKSNEFFTHLHHTEQHVFVVLKPT